MVFLYPNASFAIDPISKKKIANTFGYTFSDSGIYRVRLCYFVPEYYEFLWKGTDGELWSNEMTIEVREPTSEEKEISDSLWSGGSIHLTMGDNRLQVMPSEKALRHLIIRYPNHSLIKYAHFYLARSLTFFKRRSTIADFEEAIRIFEMMCKKYPGFRFEEVHQHLATAYGRAGRSEDARKVLDFALKKKPELLNHFYFMREVIVTDRKVNYGITEWLLDRM